MFGSFLPSLWLILANAKVWPLGAAALLRDNLLLYGFGGIIVPFLGIKLIDVLITRMGLA